MKRESLAAATEYGLSFAESRERVRSAFRVALVDLQQSASCSAPNEVIDRDYKLFYYYLSIIPLITVVMYAISLYSTTTNNKALFTAGLSVSIVFLLLSSIINYSVTYLYQKCERFEVVQELSQILADYEAVHEAKEGGANGDFIESDCDPASKPVEEMLISSGHSQVSIINTYRWIL
jgi:hypothetical protein